MIERLSFRGAFLGLTVALLRPAFAALPIAVDGEPLPSLAPMLERVTPAVVNIATQGTVRIRSNPLFNDPFFRRFFDLPDVPLQRRTQSLGSGVIVDAKRGLLLTNNHVVANADQIAVNLRDGRTFEAELVGTDPDTDIAVIKIPAENLQSVPLANSDELRVGDFVVAIGNPFNLGQTVTSGIVSALARSGLGIVGYEDFIQTDASINVGNSGGALVNLRGELVGINSAILSETGGNVGIGFAVPINMASQVMEQLVEYGEVRRGFIGAGMQDLGPDLAEAFGLKDNHGAVIVNTVPGSPAEKAGLRAGDVVTAANGRPVRGASDLRTQIGLMRVGETIRLDVLRDGKPLTFSASVGSPEDLSVDASKLRNERLAGASFGDIHPDSPAYGRLAGVMVYEVDPGSRVWSAGLRAGDVITSVNQQPVENLQGFLRVVNAARGQLLMQIVREDTAAFLVIK
jgi:serine protease Do/serine protease DegQ